MDIQTEQLLVEEAKKSLTAFDKLYDHYLPKIMAFIMNRTGSKAVAEDITSQTFVKAMLKIQSFQYRGYTFGAWLYRIAHNNLMDYYRKNKHVEIEDENRLMADDKTDVDAEQSERQRIILEALQKLPEQYQQILSLKFFEELSNDEIAEIVGCKKETLAVKLHRSLKAFEKVVKKHNFMDSLGLTNGG